MTTKEFSVLHELLLPELAGYVQKGRLVFKQPLSHFVRGINFDPSGFDKKIFLMTAFIMPLFVPSKHLTLNFGRRIRGETGGDRWNKAMANLKTELMAALRDQAIPYLESIKSLQDFVKLAQQSLGLRVDSLSYRNPRTLEALAYGLAMAGQFKQSRDTLKRLVNLADLRIPWQQEMVAQAEGLQALLAQDPLSARRQLEAWESETVKNLGLESFQK